MQAIKSTKQWRPNKKGNRERVDEFRRIVRQQRRRFARPRRGRRISRGTFLALGGTAAAGFVLGGGVAYSWNRVLSAPIFSDYPFTLGVASIREGRQIYPNTGGKTITTIAAHTA